MHIVVTVRMDQHDRLAIQKTKRHHSFLTVVFANVFPSDGEVVPNSFGPFEVHAVKLDVSTAFGFTPKGQQRAPALVMRDRTSKSLSRTRSEPAQLSRVSHRSPGPRPPGGRAERAFGAPPTLAHHGSTARWPGCCARQAAPTSYYSPSVLRTFHGSQRLVCASCS